MKKLTQSLFQREVISSIEQRYKIKILNSISVIEDIEMWKCISIIDFSSRPLSYQIQEMILIGKTCMKCFTEKYKNHIKRSPFGEFEVLVLLTTNFLSMSNPMAKTAFVMAERYLTQAIGQKSQSADIYIKRARGTAQNFLFNLKRMAEAKLINFEIGILYYDKTYELLDTLDVYQNIVNKRIVYLDNFLAITWFRSPHNSSKKFKTLGEVAISVKVNGKWSFDKHKGTSVPISSLKRAREACLNWQGVRLKGKLTHAEAERIARFLGFKIVGNTAYLP